MRLVEVLVPDDHRDAVFETLDDLDVDYVTTEETSNDHATIVSFPLPTGAVETVLEAVREDGVDESEYTVISDVESATTPRIDDLEDRYQQKPGGSHISHTGLRTATQELQSDAWTYVLLVILSAVVATAGLLLDSAVVIVGAMVISPFVGSILSASVGVVIDDREMAIESLFYQALGLVVAVVTAAAMAVVVRRTYFVPPGLVIGSIDQVASFSTPAALTMGLALFAGAAGALTLASDLGTAVAGAAVSAAIVPAAAAAGIAAVWGQPAIALGALVLVVANALFINVVSYVTFRLLGYHSGTIDSIRQELKFDSHTTGYVVAIGLTVVLLVFTGYGIYQYILFQETVNHEVQAVVEQPAYDQFTIDTVQTSYGSAYVFDRPASVTVTLGHPAGTRTPQLATRLQRRITAHTDWDVRVTVEFNEYQRATPRGQRSNADPRASRRGRVAG